jgi:hypothetical protein
MDEKKSVILPGDIPVAADKHQTVASPVASDLVASILSSPPDPLEMGVKPRYGILADFKYLVALDNRKIKQLRKKVNRLLKKYE